MNDPSELKHGVSQAGELLRARAASGPPETKRFARDFTDYYERTVADTAHYFVCSFSSDGDDLGQWRAYVSTSHFHVQNSNKHWPSIRKTL